MELDRFTELFDRTLEHNALLQLARLPPINWLARRVLDPCHDVVGMASYRKLMLLRLIASLLPRDGTECYLEVGSYQGKSLIAALRDNPFVPAVACDNFSEFDASGSNQATLEQNLRRYGVAGQVRCFDMDFRTLMAGWHELALPPVGAYFYDGAHDLASQRDAITLVEPLLAPRALVVVDDWRFARDSASRAEAGTREAIAASASHWTQLRVLPARFNGDRDLWWNGVAVFAFERRRP
jgi:predicted O-methyltransferase YrrM